MAGITAVERLVRFTGEVGSVFPEAYDVLNAEQAVVIMADNLGTPPELTRSPTRQMAEEVEALYRTTRPALTNQI